MATFKINKSDIKIIEVENEKVEIVKKDAFDKFNEDILGLGKIDTKAKTISALSVIFDLEGFTAFCKQIDPQLAVPEYLSEFLKWIFKEVKLGLTEEKYEDGYKTWSDLPFLSKYLGDGIMFLWDIGNFSETEIGNVVVSMFDICERYKTNFLPKITKNIISPPLKLRCGIARGNIYSVGNGNDFVGPCINMSARLQKLSGLSFSFSRRGINVNEFAEIYRIHFEVKKMTIRGIGEDELVCILRTEYESLSEVDKERFLDV